MTQQEQRPLEYCVDCDCATGNAGKSDGSLFLDSGEGPYCDSCFNPLRIEELETQLAEAEGKLQRFNDTSFIQPEDHQ